MSFFETGDYSDPAYGLNRDHEGRTEVKEAIEDLWTRYSGFIGDNHSHFKNHAKANFQGAIWHLYLLASLNDIGLELQRTNGDEPDIKVIFSDGRVAWIEAISVKSGSGPDAAPEPPWGNIYQPADRQILLRHTSGIQAKVAAFRMYREERQIVGPQDVAIIALNVGSVEGMIVTNEQVTYLEKSVLGIGELSFSIDIETGEVGERSYDHRPTIYRSSNAPVETTYFLDQSSSGISGILYSADHIANCYYRRTRDLMFLHNPEATCKLDKGILRFGIEKWVEENHLHFHDWRGDS